MNAPPIRYLQYEQERRRHFNFLSMALSFIWKKQLVWFITLLLVVILGLTIGAFLHDLVQDTRVSAESTPVVKVAVPSLPYPTTRPGGR